MTLIFDALLWKNCTALEIAFSHYCKTWQRPIEIADHCHFCDLTSQDLLEDSLTSHDVLHLLWIWFRLHCLLSSPDALSKLRSRFQGCVYFLIESQHKCLSTFIVNDTSFLFIFKGDILLREQCSGALGPLLEIQTQQGWL